MSAYAQLIASSVFAALPVRSLCTLCALCALCEIFVLCKSQAKKNPELVARGREADFLKGSKPARGTIGQRESMQSRPLKDLDILRLTFEIFRQYRRCFSKVAA